MTLEPPTPSNALTVHDLLDVLKRLPPETHDVRVVLWDESEHCYRPVRLVRLCTIDGTREIQARMQVNTAEAVIGLF
jgi:hypothetical protein